MGRRFRSVDMSPRYTPRAAVGSGNLGLVLLRHHEDGVGPRHSALENRRWVDDDDFARRREVCSRNSRLITGAVRLGFLGRSRYACDRCVAPSGGGRDPIALERRGHSVIGFGHFCFRQHLEFEVALTVLDCVALSQNVRFASGRVADGWRADRSAEISEIGKASP